MKDYLYKSILIVQIIAVFDWVFFLVGFSSQVYSLIKYFVFFIATFYYITGIKRCFKKPSIITMLFLIWILYIIATGIYEAIAGGFNTINFKKLISGYLFVYLIPFLTATNLDLSFLKRYLKLGYYLALLSIVMMIICIPYILNRESMYAEAATLFATGLSLLLMTYSYYANKVSKRTIYIYLIMTFVMMFLARRNKVVYFGSVLFFAMIINSYFLSLSNRSSNKRTMFYLMGLSALVLIGFSDSFSFFFERVNTGMDSREVVTSLFIEDFNQHPSDWILGRGMWGEYFGGANATNELTGTRYGIESGYYQHILNGGWIWLGLLIMVSIKSVFLGFSKSNNLLCKGAACIILVYFLDMIGFGIPTTNLQYINVFICLSICNSQMLRSFNDNDLIDYLNIKN